MFIPNREELSWTAGFFDGEGNTGCWAAHKAAHKTYYKITMQLNQVGDECITRFHNAIHNIGKLYYVKGRNSGCKDQRRWAISKFEDVQAVIALLWPFLCSVKRDQIEAALIKYKEHLA